MKHQTDAYVGIWERRQGETALSYQRFLDYVRMPKRSITALAEKYGIAPQYLRLIASPSKNDWVNRAAAYDVSVQAEVDKTTRQAVLLAATDTEMNSRWLREHEKMQLQLWEFRSQLIGIVQKMVNDFEVGTKAKSATKTYFTHEDVTDKHGKVQRIKVKNIVKQSSNDPHWTYGDTIRAIEMIDRLGNEVLNLPSEVISKLPELVYQLRRNGHDPNYFVQSTIDKLKAS